MDPAGFMGFIRRDVWVSHEDTPDMFQKTETGLVVVGVRQIFIDRLTSPLLARHGFGSYMWEPLGLG